MPEHNNPTPTPGLTVIGGGGATRLENAFVIDAPCSLMGVPAIYINVSKTYGQLNLDWFMFRQSLCSYYEKDYDVLLICLKNGEYSSI